MTERLIRLAQDAIQTDSRGWTVWNSFRGFPGDWPKKAITCARIGFMRAQAHKPAARVHNDPTGDDAYLLGHQLCRDLREDGPQHRIGAALREALANEDGAFEDHAASAIVYAWFIFEREDYLAPATARDTRLPRRRGGQGAMPDDDNRTDSAQSVATLEAVPEASEQDSPEPEPEPNEAQPGPAPTEGVGRQRRGRKPARRRGRSRGRG
jgi:hypothetical protein